MFFASMPWYDLREVRPATDAFWRHLARAMRKHGLSNVPSGLNRRVPCESQWTSGKLLFSQACGYDVLLAYRKTLRILATPVYQAPACRGPRYTSMIVVREDSKVEHLEELRGSRCVINSPTSHSGMNVLQALVAPMQCNGRFFSVVTASGSHERSLRMIAENRADVAAIDCVTYSLLERHRPEALSQTRLICSTSPIPAPPFVVDARLTDQQTGAIREALLETLEAPAVRPIKETLLLDGVETLPLEAYQPIADMESFALEQGYTQISGAAAARMQYQSPAAV